ncbi:MAG TPA: maleylpyruvate isomerase family mycothiol-dependent enzyme [Rhodopila sp.]|jgi:uncharacterized protein (TIGR03084 family)|nr:maleylpyruvate isomerase family mycothiol-dependent enzyme [Rhodopila sp.]
MLATASAEGPIAFDRLNAEIRALRDGGMTRLQETRYRLGHLTGQRLRQQWHGSVLALCERLATLPTSTRLKWTGPDMGLRMFTTARQMETWAHGQEVFDVLGRTRRPTDRLRNIAEIGVRTYGWTFANRGLQEPGPPPYVRLTAPSGGIWEWNPLATNDRIEGDALDFCQVVTQVRNVSDTALCVIGAAAHSWMQIAQCFAGPPEEPPMPGTRFAAARRAWSTIPRD